MSVPHLLGDVVHQAAYEVKITGSNAYGAAISRLTATLGAVLGWARLGRWEALRALRCSRSRVCVCLGGDQHRRLCALRAYRGLPNTCCVCFLTHVGALFFVAVLIHRSPSHHGMQTPAKVHMYPNSVLTQ